MKFNKLYKLLNEANVNNLLPKIQQNYIQMVADNIISHNRIFNKNNKVPKTYNDLADEQKEELKNLLVNEKKAYIDIVNSITPNPQYQSWIFQILVDTDQIHFPEDKDKLKELLEQFSKVKNSGNWKSSKNILDFKSYSELHKVVSDFIELNKASVTLNLGNNKIVIQKGEYKVVKLENYKDAFPLLDNTGWCVKNERYFNNYGAPFYLILKNNNRYMLFHSSSKQCKNIHDEAIKDPNEVDKDLYDIVIQLYMIDKDTSEYNVDRYIESLSSEENDLIPIIFKYTNSKNKLSIIFNNVTFLKYIKQDYNDIEFYKILVILSKHNHNNRMFISYLNNIPDNIKEEFLQENTKSLLYFDNITLKDLEEAYKLDPNLPLSDLIIQHDLNRGSVKLRELVKSNKEIRDFLLSKRTAISFVLKNIDYDEELVNKLIDNDMNISRYIFNGSAVLDNLPINLVTKLFIKHIESIRYIRYFNSFIILDDDQKYNVLKNIIDNCKEGNKLKVFVSVNLIINNHNLKLNLYNLLNKLLVYIIEQNPGLKEEVIKYYKNNYDVTNRLSQYVARYLGL